MRQMSLVSIHSKNSSQIRENNQNMDVKLNFLEQWNLHENFLRYEESVIFPIILKIFYIFENYQKYGILIMLYFTWQ